MAMQKTVSFSILHGSDFLQIAQHTTEFVKPTLCTQCNIEYLQALAQTCMQFKKFLFKQR